MFHVPLNLVKSVQLINMHAVIYQFTRKSLCQKLVPLVAILVQGWAVNCLSHWHRILMFWSEMQCCSYCRFNMLNHVSLTGICTLFSQLCKQSTLSNDTVWGLRCSSFSLLFLIENNAHKILWKGVPREYAFWIETSPYQHFPVIWLMEFGKTSSFDVSRWAMVL